MPRIIAGAAGGRRLQVVPGNTTRPTTDRVKEAMFASLEAADALVGVKVLDLYSGTGGLGLEALSRGASSVRLVESDPVVLRILAANVEAVALGGIEVVAATVERELATAQGGGYGLVLADPPYSIDINPVLAALVDGQWLVPGGMVVVERSSRSVPPTWPEGIEPVRDKKYGETTLWYGRRP